MRYLNKIGFHIVQSYVENETKDLQFFEGAGKRALLGQAKETLL